MTSTDVFTFLLFELHMNPSLCYITLGRLDLAWVRTLPVEEAVEVVEDVADGVLIDATALKLHPHFQEAGMQLSPAAIKHVAELMYLPGANYPFETVLERYENLLLLGSQSDTFGHALQVAQNLPPHPHLFLLQ